MNRAFIDWKHRYDAQRIATDADQSEWEAVRLHTTNIDAGIRDEIMGGELANTEAREDRAAVVSDEVRRRSALLGKNYPFSRSGNSLQYNGSASRVYEFWLCITFLESLSTEVGKRFQIAFERLIRDVLVSHLGGDAIGLRTGVPNDSLEPRPEVIKGIIAELNKLAPDEWRWNPEHRYPEEPDITDLGDLGMDVVACRPFEGKRGSDLFFVGQCACGLTDWHQKLHEPDAQRLSSWIRPITYVPFVRVFAVPFHLPNTAFLGEVAKSSRALPLDRARIVEIAERAGNSEHIRTQAKEAYETLVNLAISGGRVVPRGSGRSRRKGGAGRRSRSRGSADESTQP